MSNKPTYEELVSALRAVMTGSTAVIRKDSTGQDICNIRAASVERVRDVLALVDPNHHRPSYGR